MTRPVWADFEMVWSRRTPNSMVHILEGESFSVHGERGSVRTRCGRTPYTDTLDREFGQRGSLSQPQVRTAGTLRTWCDRCKRTME